MFRGTLLFVTCLLAGCSHKPLDYCGLLTLSDVAQLHDGVVTRKMEEWYASSNHPTRYCSWKDDKNRNVLSLSVSLATTHSSEEIASVFSSGSKVINVQGVGTDAAAFFYPGKDDSREHATLLARNHWWSIDLRAPIEGGPTGSQFAALQSIANQVFSNIHEDKELSRLEK